MGIYRTMQDNEICISLHRSSRSDLFFYLDVNEAIEHATKLMESIKKTETEIHSLENLLDFFAVKRIASFSAAINAVKEPDKQAVLTALTDLALVTPKSFATGKIIRYINNEYETLLGEKTGATEDVHNLFFPLVEFCIQFQTGISDPVFMHIATKHWFVYITYYDELKKKLLASRLLFEAVFSEENVKNLVRSKCGKLLEIAKTLSGHNDYYNNLNEHILNCTVEIMRTAGDRDVLAYGDSIRRVRRYFSEIRYDQQKMRQFEEAYNEYDRKLSDYLDKHGHLFSHQIPGDMADKIMGSNAAWITKQLLMTHSLKEDKIVSQFTFPDPEEPSLVDMVSHNIDTDEYFTYSRQQKIQIAGSIGTALIMQIYSNPQYKEDCMAAIAGIVSAIAAKCGFQDDDLIADLIALDQSLQFVDAARKKDGAENCWSLVYGASMLIMACTEKILRLAYKHEKEIVLSDEVIQIGPLLSNETIEAVLSKDLMRGVGFYLSKYGYIGLNYRNRLAHLSGITIDDISNTLPYTFFYLYMCVVNGLLIHYCGDMAVSISLDN